jgi:hypothetical protein
MKTYKLYLDEYTKQLKDFASEIVDGIPTGVNVNIHTNQAYLKWVAEGNTPLPADEVQP